MKKVILLGVAKSDGHTRITHGDDFTLMGGTKDTHEIMQETAIKFTEELKKRGKQMDELRPQEFSDVLYEVINE